MGAHLSTCGVSRYMCCGAVARVCTCARMKKQVMAVYVHGAQGFLGWC